MKPNEYYLLRNYDKFSRAGIDVSSWQGLIDWKTAKSSITFAMLRISVNGTPDKFFARNYAEARAAGVKVGAYIWDKNLIQGARAGKACAEKFIKQAGELKFEYPIAIDIENMDKKRKEAITAAVLAWDETMARAGFYTCIYGSDIATFRDLVDVSKLHHLDKWVARYGSKPVYISKPQIWQSSSTGKIAGINDNVDINTTYVDYEQIIKEGHFNGF